VAFSVAFSVKKAPIQSLVAFIDLLGFSARVVSAKTLDDFNAIYEQIDRIRELFEHEPKSAEERDVHRQFEKQVLAFSDSVVISVGTHSYAVRSMGGFDALGLELSMMADAQGACVASGYFVAGGLDVGMWYYEDGILISPALVRAYQLHEKTRMPVLAVSDAIYASF
jgi:hypothetical protein